MSEGPIPLIKPTDLRFVPEAIDLQSILNDQLGQLGTDQDGFDQILNDTITLSAEAGTILANLDGDLNAAAAVVPEFGTTAPADLAASLQPASDAADTVLNDFTQSVAPTPDQGTGPQPAPAQPYTPPKGAQITTLPAMKVNGKLFEVHIDDE